MSFAESISHQATYEPKGITPSGLSIRSHKLISNAGSATIQPNQVFEFSIPTGNDALLDTNSMSLEFGIAVKETANDQKTIRTDGCAFSLLQSFTLLHNSVPLETMNELPLLANILFDLGMSFSDRATIQGTRFGMLTPMDLAYSITFADGVVEQPEGTSTTLSTGHTAEINRGQRAPDMTQTRWGCSIWLNKNAEATPSEADYLANKSRANFSLPVLSGFVGSLAHRATPLYAMNGDLRLRFQTNLLERGLQATITGNAQNITSGYEWKLLDVRLVYKTIHLGDLANQMRLAYPMPTIASQYYGHNSCSITSTDAQVQKTLSFRYSSLNDVLFTMSPTEKSGQTFNPEYTRRVRNNMSSFAIVIDGKYYPSQKMDTTKQCEILGYLAESQHAKNKAFWANSIVSSAQGYLATIPAANGAGISLGNPFMNFVGNTASSTGAYPFGYMMNCTFPENFILGITTQSFQHSDQALLSGVDTLDKQVTAEMNFAVDATSQNCTAHFFSFFDVIYTIDSVGQTSVRY